MGEADSWLPGLTEDKTVNFSLPEQIQLRLPPLLSYMTSPPTPGAPAARGGSPGGMGYTYWGTMVIWTKQMKRKTSEAHAT